MPALAPPPAFRPADFDLAYVTAALERAGALTAEQRREAHAREPVLRARLARERADKERRRFYEVSPVEIVAALAFPAADRQGQVLDEDRVTEIVAGAAGIPYRKIDPLKLDMALIARTFSGPYAERHALLPLEMAGGTLVVACANPFDRELFDSVASLVGGPVQPVLASKRDILRAIDHVYGFRRSVNAAAQDAAPGLSLGNLEQLVSISGERELGADERPVVAAVEYLLRYAFDQRASDIHIEPRRDSSQVRMRIDGVLHPVHTMPKGAHAPIVSRLKTLARLDIAEKRRPQDGRIKTSRGGREIELRMSTVPVAFGEKVVLRVFDPEVQVQDLSQLGFEPAELQVFQSWIARPHGLILVTGPTGSGKTTTLYAALRALADEGVNITTIEDPIEVVHEAFNQVQVQPKIDLDFASALRHILRQDPDIVMVGEIRDRETAEYAVQAALTGHLVLSTLHTNSAADAITRLLDLGVTPFLAAGALVGIMAQRLVRVVCASCAAPASLAADELTALGVPIPDLHRPDQGFKKGTGCARCRDTGYFGRTGIYEMLSVDKEIAELVATGRPASAIEQVARRKGLRTLREAAAAKIALGKTTVEEVIRVTAQ